MKNKIQIDKSKCVECGACTGVCKFNALIIEKPEWTISYDETLCKTCHLCITACPLHAINFSI